MQRKKRKEVPALEPSDASRCIRVQTPKSRIIYKLQRCARPTCDTQGDLRQGPHHKTLVCYGTLKNLKEESNTEKEEGIIAKKDTQVVVEKKLEEVDLSTDP